jgi:hypothetical protein
MSLFDERVASFCRLGMSEAAAKIAVIGRHETEAGSRAWHDELDAQMDAQDAAIREAQAAKATASPTPALAEAMAAVEVAAVGELRMDSEAAKKYAVQLAEREIAKGGVAHADGYLRTFARGLTVKANGR